MKKYTAKFLAGIIGLTVGALAAIAIGIAISALSLMLIMPHSGWAGPMLGVLILLIFGFVFSVVYREMLEKFTR